MAAAHTLPTAIYFAYGSNMCLARLRDPRRVPSAQALGRARLRNRRLVCNKRGIDGSGKANLEALPGGEVWGVLFAVAVAELVQLDQVEERYRRHYLPVEQDTGTLVTALVYISDYLIDTPVMYDWYKQFLLDGAHEHGLPDAYQRFLAGLPARPDPRAQG